MSLGVGLLLCGIATAQIASSIPVPRRGTENIQVLFRNADFVAKGEVTKIQKGVLSRAESEATIIVDRFYKGRLPKSAQVRFAGGPSGLEVAPATGDYLLLFLKKEAEDDAYSLIDPFFGALPVSRVIGDAIPAPSEGSMQLLEMDLKAAISKGQHEEVLDSIRMLGNMRSVSSVEEIAAIMPAEDDNLAAEIYLALLQLGDYRYLGETVSFLQRAVMTNRQRWIQSRIGAVLAEVQTSSAFDDIVRLVSSPNVGLRLSAVRAIRNMRTERSIPFLIARLSDQEWLIRYTAMAALAEATNKTEGWVPPLLDFRQQEAPFIAKWQSWWAAEGMHLHKAQQSTGEEPRAVAAPRRRE